MQQNKENSEKKVVRLDQSSQNKPLQNPASYLMTLGHQLPKGSAALQGIKTTLSLLKKIDTAQKETEKNTAYLQELKEQFSRDLKALKSYIGNHKNGQFSEMMDTIVKLENTVQDQNVKTQETMSQKAQDNSTANDYLHSMGFDQIVTMINAASIHEPEWMSRTGTVLILDNNPNTSQALNRRLTKEGHTVLHAEDEVGAFACLQTYPVEALLLDYVVFREELYDFLRKLEMNQSIGYTPIIIIGAPESTEVMQKLTEAGVGDYLAKPVNPALLKMRVHAVLEKKYAFEQRLQRTKEMQRTRRELESAIQDLPDGFAIFDQTDHLVMHNDKLFEFYPHLSHQENMVRGGLTFEKFLEANVDAGLYAFQDDEDARQWIDEKRGFFLLPASQWEETLNTGRILGITTYRTPDGGGALVAKDISQDKAQHQDLTFLAYHDSLTGLPNRKAFLQKLSHSLQKTKGTDKLLAVLFLDLDGFKYINDTYGHEMGDWLLNQVGHRLKRCIRGDDLLARFGGDEFCIILNDATNRTKVEMVARRILNSISDPYIRKDITMHVGVSIGIGVYEPRITNGEGLLKEADTAMYAVKQSGKGGYRFFDEISKKTQASRKPKPAKSSKDGQKNSH